MPLAAGSNLGPYRIVEQVGRGGMATVYKAFQPSLKRFVAIKVLPEFLAEDEGFRLRFEQEAVAVASLRHQNILTVFDHGELDGVAYIVTEFVEGGTLADQLGKPLPTEYTVRTLGPLASALDYAHGRGVLHRDLKPSNVLIGEDGTPILSDFGLALMMTTHRVRLTQTGTILGTPEYMSPEQCEGDDVTAASDIYSLGVVAYEMLTGRVPFSAPTPAGVLIAQIQNRLPPPRQINPKLSPGVEAALLKALAKDPADRFRTAGDFVRALTAEAETSALLSTRRPVRGAGSGLTSLASRQLMFAVAGVALLAIAGAAFLFYQPPYGLGGNLSSTASPTASPSPSPPLKGPLAFQARLDGTGSDLTNLYQIGDTSASKIAFAPGSIVFSVLKTGGNTGAAVNFNALSRYVAEIDLSVRPGSNVDFWWTVRTGGFTLGNLIVEINTVTERLHFENFVPTPDNSLGPPPTVLSKDVALRGLQTGKTFTLTAVVDPPAYTIYVNQSRVIDVQYAPLSDPGTVGLGCFGQGGSVTVSGLRLYTMP